MKLLKNLGLMLVIKTYACRFIKHLIKHILNINYTFYNCFFFYKNFKYKNKFPLRYNFKKKLRSGKATL